MKNIYILVTSLMPLVGCMSSYTLISCEDAITLPQRTITLRAKLEEQDYHLDDIKNQPVKFKLISSPTHERKLDDELYRSKIDFTDNDGWARVRVRFPVEGLYRFKVFYEGNERFYSSEDELTVLVVGRDRPVIVVDIDGTLTKRKTWYPWCKEPIPYDNYAAKVLRQLAEKYAIVYLSGRPLPLHKVTRKWLEKYGFPKGPVVLWWLSSPRWLTVKNYKVDTLDSLKQAGINLVWGIGNTEDDIEAYLKAGLKAIAINSEKARGAYRVDSWYEIGKILLR